MAFSHHALDNVRPLRSGVDGALADVDTSDEEGGLEAILLELVKYTVGVDVRAVIVSDSNGSGSLTDVDTFAAVCNIALLGTSVVAGAGAGGSLVGIACRAKVDKTVRGVTVVFGCTAVSL
jgi:hypothetical protein